MKRIALFILTALLFAACQKEDSSQEPQPQPEPEPSVSLTGTAWVGVYEDNFQGYPATLTWSLDFLTDSTGELFLDLVVANQSQAPMTQPFTYTFDGISGTCFFTNGGATQFIYNANDTTITMAIGINANGGVATLGGLTTFYPRGSQPEPATSFPENSTWQTSQQVTVDDSATTVTWTLEFWDHATGGTLTYRCNGNGTSTLVYWQYDNSTHSGSIRLNGADYTFTYDQTSEILTLDYSTTMHGTDVAIGGTLQFTADVPAESSRQGR